MKAKPDWERRMRHTLNIPPDVEFKEPQPKEKSLSAVMHTLLLAAFVCGAIFGFSMAKMIVF